MSSSILKHDDSLESINFNQYLMTGDDYETKKYDQSLLSLSDAKIKSVDQKDKLKQLIKKLNKQKQMLILKKEEQAQFKANIALPQAEQNDEQRYEIWRQNMHQKLEEQKQKRKESLDKFKQGKTKGVQSTLHYRWEKEFMSSVVEQESQDIKQKLQKIKQDHSPIRLEDINKHSMIVQEQFSTLQDKKRQQREELQLTQLQQQRYLNKMQSKYTNYIKQQMQDDKTQKEVKEQEKFKLYQKRQQYSSNVVQLFKPKIKSNAESQRLNNYSEIVSTQNHENNNQDYGIKVTQSYEQTKIIPSRTKQQQIDLPHLSTIKEDNANLAGKDYQMTINRKSRAKRLISSRVINESPNNRTIQIDQMRQHHNDQDSIWKAQLSGYRKRVNDYEPSTPKGKQLVVASLKELDRKIQVYEGRMKSSLDSSVDQIKVRKINDEMMIESIKLKLALLNNIACQ
ncbi:UNKNOWN [Stylonychia lemnae]|uniref:Uncharacterized protein n=1 Tax=Stylonychia lemnae TaxID=5949 RepID=A0A078AR85_STYLE|nr:UNKNOWN [Stylonychia lemnae]|eukprot:CDW84729.1 UNKNOWN [Stylonychia lemnae]